MSYQQIIYNRLRQKGISEAGALGIIGNFQCESNCEPFRLQGDFSPYRTQSKAFVAACANGSKTKADFCNGRVGFGIAQWTYPARQAELWGFWKKSGKALDDAEMQTDFAVKELQRYSDLYAFMKTTNDIFTACSRFCREWERPAVNNIDARFSAAKKYQAELDLNGWMVATEDEPQDGGDESVYPAPAVDDRLVLRTTDEHCAGWPEASLVQAILIRRGYDLHVVDGVWDDEEIEEIKMFQRNHGLDADGIVGPKTWAELLKR